MSSLQQLAQIRDGRSLLCSTSSVEISELPALNQSLRACVMRDLQSRLLEAAFVSRSDPDNSSFPLIMECVDFIEREMDALCGE